MLNKRLRQSLEALDSTRLRSVKKTGRKPARQMAYGLLIERRNDARQ